MKMKKESGVTMLMLVITIVVMLILASVITFYTVRNNYLLNNAQEIKVVDRIRNIRDKINEDEVLLQSLSGNINATLSESEINAILGEYADDLIVQVETDQKTDQKKSVLYYRNDSTKFTEEDKKTMEEKLDITGK